MDELTREFLIESQEGLDRMERGLTELEERPDDAALLADIFRAVHTIKGTTGFLGFKRLEELAHAGENLLGLLRDGKLAANRSMITGLLELLDGLRSILKTIEADGGEGEGEDAELIGRLEELQAPAQSRQRVQAKGTTVSKVATVAKHVAAAAPVAPAPDEIASQPDTVAVEPCDAAKLRATANPAGAATPPGLAQNRGQWDGRLGC
jgi:two-component system chemotaxis sensor kinase CheA